jgi:hypothetical protein
MSDRGRIPFALIGVLLLVSSATLAPGLVSGPDPGQPDVDVAMDRATAETRAALEAGVERGARLAARGPVVDAANTSFGRVLNATDTFRDALKVRIYTTVRRQLRATVDHRRGLNVTASLPATGTPAALRRAKRRVDLDTAGPNGTALSVSVGNVTLTARRDGRVVGRTRIDPTVVVPVPVLPVHERVRTFERLLDGGPLDPGLSRLLTAKLYAVVWARGYAQVGGLPIQNVLANRHLSLLANGGVLSLQGRVFGRSDPVGRKVHGLTTLETAVLDVLSTGAPGTLRRLQDVRRAIALDDPASGAATAALTGTTDFARPSDTVTVGVNATADAAFVRLLDELNETIEETYTASVRLRVAEHHRRGGRPDWPEPPGEEWTRLGSNETASATVEPLDREPGEAPGEWHRLASYSRTVDVEWTRTRRWVMEGEVVTRETDATETVALSLLLEGSHQNGRAPTAPIRTVHEPGGPLDGPNLEGIRDDAVSELVTAAGGPDRLAERAARGDLDTIQGRIQGDRPDGIYEWLYADVAELRDVVRNVTVETTRGDVATFQANPALTLVRELRNESARLAPVPASYGSVANRTRLGARLAYLGAVENGLQERAQRRNASRMNLAMKLSSNDNTSLRSLHQGYERRNDWESIPESGVEMRVNAAPAYLSTSEATRETVPALEPGRSYHPLVARNLNVFSLPYGEFADLFTKLVLGPKHVEMRTGGEVLRTANALHRRNGSTLNGPDVISLRNDVNEAMGFVSRRFAAGMGDRFHGSIETWHGVFEDAAFEYGSVRGRAMAIANGSIVGDVVAEAAAEWPERAANEVWRDRVRLTARVAIRRIRSLDRAGPTQPDTDRAVERLRTALEGEVARQLGGRLGDGTLRALRKTANPTWSRLPAGLPVAPTPGLWFATVNLWQAQVRGEYARFAVTVPRGTPANPGGAMAYVRDGSAVRVDVDGDGERERLGTASRVAFSAESWVGIAVPPNSPGVGDVDGVQNETSRGWPWPSGAPTAPK